LSAFKKYIKNNWLRFDFACCPELIPDVLHKMCGQNSAGYQPLARGLKIVNTLVDRCPGPSCFATRRADHQQRIEQGQDEHR
jgi:hypothetical protein